jgi:hypothetical protein
MSIDNMGKCEECGKTLGIFEGYRHPTLGKSHLLCSPCFNQVSESVEKWKEFISPYADFFNNRQSNDRLEPNWKNRQTDFTQIKKIAGNIRA